MVVIELAKMSWAAPTVFDPKRDGSLSFCIDQRKLNIITIPDSYPTPRKDENLNLLCNSQIFSTLDAHRIFWQGEIDDADCDKKRFYNASWDVYIFRNAICITQRTWPMTTKNGSSIIAEKRAVSRSVPRKCYHTFLKCRLTYITCPYCTVSLTQILRYAES